MQTGIKLGKNIRTENPFCPQCKCNLKYPTAVHLVDCEKDNMIENVEDWKPGQIVLFNDTDHQQAAIEALTGVEFHEDEVNWRDGVDQLGGSAQFMSLREELAGELIAAAEPHLRKKWAEEINDLMPGIVNDTKNDYARGVKAGINYVLAILEGAGE